MTRTAGGCRVERGLGWLGAGAEHTEAGQGSLRQVEEGGRAPDVGLDDSLQLVGAGSQSAPVAYGWALQLGCRPLHRSRESSGRGLVAPVALSCHPGVMIIFGGVCYMDIFAKQQWHCPPGSSR
jgi:hypothetical protein